MLQNEMISNLRIELQDTTQALYQDDELVRAIDKSVALLSRLIPRRAVVEKTIMITITGETLTILNSTGTLAYKPVKVASIEITGKTLDTDYRIDYLTGVITEIGSGLPDTTYTVSYSLDTTMLDLSTFLTDYIRIESVEYPVVSGNPSRITYEVLGDYLLLKSNAILSDNKHIRIIYFCEWTPPTDLADGNYPNHLDDSVIIGATGQALIYKAEKYTKLSADTVAAALTLLDGISTLVPTIADITPPTAPTLASLTPPSAYTIVKPTAPTITAVPTAPTAPTITLDDVEAALDDVDVQLTTDPLSSDHYLETGDDLINAATRGDNVGEVYATYARTKVEMATARLNEGIARIRELELTLTKYASEVTSYGSAVNGYANYLSGIIGKYREEINAEVAGVNNAGVAASIFSSQVQNNNALVSEFQAEVQLYQSQVSEAQSELKIYVDKSDILLKQAAQSANMATQYLEIAGRFLASGQAKINEMIAMLGSKIELFTQKSSMDQRT